MNPNFTRNINFFSSKFCSVTHPDFLQACNTYCADSKRHFWNKVMQYRPTKELGRYSKFAHMVWNTSLWSFKIIVINNQALRRTKYFWSLGQFKGISLQETGETPEESFHFWLSNSTSWNRTSPISLLEHAQNSDQADFFTGHLKPSSSS